MIERIGQIALVFKNLDGAVAFYRDTLGLRFLFSAGPRLAFFDCGGTMLMFSPAERPEFDHANNILYFNVADIAAAHAGLSAKGVRFESAPHVVARLPAYDLWLAEFRDPENNVLALRSEVRK
ncbi:MAG TPA: VOC family protein [Opitutus sp.]|nr:VOC family protein [Opitutus sp.]